MPTRKLSYMSSSQIREIEKQEAVLILPIGCVEQHGPVGYVGADAILAECVAERAAEALEHVYVAPPLWYGYTPYTAWPGTVTLRLETLQALVHDVVFGYLAHGFRRLVIVNNHGPNEAAIEPVAREVREEYGLELAIVYPWRLASSLAKEKYPEMSGSFGHGGEPTISVMMALAPGVIDTSADVKRGYVKDGTAIDIVSYRSARFEGQEVGLFSDPTEILPSGASGDWRHASEEVGKAVLEDVVQFTIRFLEHFEKRPLPTEEEH